MPPFSSNRPRYNGNRAGFSQRTQQQPAPRVVSNVKPSAYQQAIMDWFMGSTGNALVDAKAGSGKTSTLCMLADMIPNTARAAFLAFNRSIADELKRRLPAHVQAATFHSITRSALLRMPQFAHQANNRQWVNKSKGHMLFDQMLDSYMDAEQFRRGVLQLVALMKANVLLPNCMEQDMLDLVSRYDIEFDESMADGGVEQGCKMARELLTRNNAELNVIDFDDMLYFAYILNAPVMKYTHLMVDEAQDTNLVQRRLIARMLTPTSRAIFVGDPFQAIYGFRGADSEAMNNIAEEFACTRLPLSISYRCPAQIIKLAQRIVPEIEARENAPQGTVKKLDTMNLVDFTHLDLVVCRNTAPLVSLGFRFLKAHKPVKIMGKEIGEQLVSLIQKMRAATVEELADKLDEYTKREVERAMKKRQESKAEQLNDQHDAVISIIEGLPEDARTVYEVIQVIRQLFTDDAIGKQTTLSTVHKAKGMESHTVYILDGHLMPSKWAKQPWQQVQETNLKYVAVTRAMDSLYFIESTQIQ